MNKMTLLQCLTISKLILILLIKKGELERFTIVLTIHRIGVWGRSMGAVTSLLFAASDPDPNIRLLILDSPFTDLSQLMKEYIDRFKVRKRELWDLDINLFQDCLENSWQLYL